MYTATLRNLANMCGYHRFRYLGYVCTCWRKIWQTTNRHSYAAASGLSLNGSGDINNLVAFPSSINPINQSQLTVDLGRSPAPLTTANTCTRILGNENNDICPSRCLGVRASQRVKELCVSENGRKLEEVKALHGENANGSRTAAIFPPLNNMLTTACKIVAGRQQKCDG